MTIGKEERIRALKAKFGSRAQIGGKGSMRRKVKRASKNPPLADKVEEIMAKSGGNALGQVSGIKFFAKEDQGLQFNFPQKVCIVPKAQTLLVRGVPVALQVSTPEEGTPEEEKSTEDTEENVIIEEESVVEEEKFAEAQIEEVTEDKTEAEEVAEAQIEEVTEDNTEVEEVAEKETMVEEETSVTVEASEVVEKESMVGDQEPATKETKRQPKNRYEKRLRTNLEKLNLRGKMDGVSHIELNLQNRTFCIYNPEIYALDCKQKQTRDHTGLGSNFLILGEMVMNPVSSVTNQNLDKLAETLTLDSESDEDVPDLVPEIATETGEEATQETEAVGDTKTTEFQQSDIDLVCSQTGKEPKEVVEALKEAKGDLITAIMALT